MHPAVIRGNASEVMVVAGAVDRAGKGVDSSHSTDSALGYAVRLARETQSIVAMTGVVDYVTDGQRVAAIENGHPLMAKVTGLGCTASALVGAFLAANDDRFTATVAALATLGVVGELAAAKSEGPGTLQLQILDLLYLIDRATLEAWAKVKLVAPPAA
jgi:hydroxyethylthiazole kinase